MEGEVEAEDQARVVRYITDSDRLLGGRTLRGRRLIRDRELRTRLP